MNLLNSSMGMLDYYHKLDEKDINDYIVSVGWKKSPEEFRQQLTKQVLLYSVTEEEKIKLLNHTNIKKTVVLPSGKVITGTIRCLD